MGLDTVHGPPVLLPVSDGLGDHSVLAIHEVQCP